MAFHSKIYRINRDDIASAPFEGHYGDAFSNCYSIGFKMKSGQVLDLLFFADDSPMERENEITSKIRDAFTIDCNKPEFAECIIDGDRYLAIKLPKALKETSTV